MRDIDVHLPDRRLWGRWLNESAHAVAPGIPTIVFLHEGLGSVGLWREFPEAVCRRAGLRGFAYDRTGYGRSSPWPVEPDRNYMAVEGDHVLPQLLDAARIGTCVLVGHSDGGTIALNYASAQPSMLRGVVTIGAHVISEPRTLDAIRLARAQYDAGGLRGRLERHHGANVDGAFRLWNDAWLSPGFEPMDAAVRLPRIHVPVLALQGEHDEYGTTAQLDAISEGVSGPCQTRVVPGCGHSPHLQAESDVVEMVAHFIETVGRDPAPAARRAAGGLGVLLACVLAGSIEASAQAACQGPQVRAALERAVEQIHAFDDAEAAAALRPAASAACPEAVLASAALDGWVEARRLASVGGAPERMGPVRRLLARLDELAVAGSPTLLSTQASAYSHAIVRAAVAAAQDERDEMQVYLAHAQALAGSLTKAGVARMWPLGMDLAEGELLLEVDQLEQARAAFVRAESLDPGARPLVGLARVARRLRDQPAACSAYRRAGALALGDAVRQEVADALEHLMCPDR